MGQRHGFETASIDPAMTDKQCETAGWIHALNRTGEAIDVPCRPVGTIHFCCLRTIYGSRAWVEAMAGGLQPPEWNKLTRDTLKKAEENAARYHPLAAYDAAAIRYPLESTTRSVIEFVRTWTPAWRIVFKALEVGAR